MSYPTRSELAKAEFGSELSQKWVIHWRQCGNCEAWLRNYPWSSGRLTPVPECQLGHKLLNQSQEANK